MELLYFFGSQCEHDWPFSTGRDSLQILASHRLRAWMPARELTCRGHAIRTIASHREFVSLPALQSKRCMVIGKLSHPDPKTFGALISEVHAVIDQARIQCIPVLVDYSDDLVARGDFRNRPTLEVLRRADAVVCASTALADRVSLYLGEGARIHMIPDPVEGSLRKAHASAADGGAPLRLLWFGHPASFHTLLVLLQPLDSLARSHPLELEILTNLPAEQLVELQLGILGAKLSYPIQFCAWESQGSVFEALERTHVVLLPVDSKGTKPAASNNRLTEALWGGCFVVASSLPSYADFLPFSWQGEHLIEGLRWFFDQRSQADRLIEQAQEMIARSYIPEAIADRWEQMLLAVEPSRPPADGSATGLAGLTAPRLNLGCGNHPLPGYLNIDIVSERATVRPDLVCDVRNLHLLPDNYAKEILAVHVIEHFWRWEIEDILAEWIRVLLPGGKLILECPNLLAACEELLRDPRRAAGPGREGQHSMWVFYGDPVWQDPLMCHRWGYTPESLIHLLVSVGLVAARQEPAMFKLREPRDMRITAVKPAVLTPSAPPPSA